MSQPEPPQSPVVASNGFVVWALARSFEQGRGSLIITPDGHGWELTSVQPGSPLHIVATYTHTSGIERTVTFKVVP